jgi:DNA-binding SARP family transcriptional activator/predicted ATPase
MARLTVSLLGSFDIKLDDQPVTALVTGKVRALLAYLVVEDDRPHRRETLAGLLWPDYPERSARASLRNALSDLRATVGDRDAVRGHHDPHLLVTRETIQFNAESDCWVDVAAFNTAIEQNRTDPAALALESAAVLYAGPFLEGFSLADSPAFENWALVVRERLEQQALQAFQSLAAYHDRRGEYARAREYTRRQIALAPWQEQAHRALMRLLALSGQRGAALAQYEACRRALREELEVEPGEETQQLYESIQSGELVRSHPEPVTEPPVRLPAFLSPPADQEERSERPLFVARKHELAQLDRFLDLALAGQGRVALVTGEAGSGKTSLLQEFTRRAQEAHAAAFPDHGPRSDQALIAASGNCNAYTGIGDPYLPFREILELLTGDVQARWAAGAITGAHARRLWQSLPLVAQALAEAGPDLIDTFVPGVALLERVRACMQHRDRADWQARLSALVERKPAGGPLTSIPQQIDLFEQVTRVLQALSLRRPLLLVLDDLQWADLGSISLLFHLGRRLAGHRVLIVGAYRPEDVAIGRNGEQHPLEPVVHELQRVFGEIAVALGQAEGRDFMEAFLDSEPNRLGDSFREMLYRQTGGHPLFTIELLRGLQERGDVVRDSEGCWVEGPALDWTALPARVEAVIAERIGRLPDPLRAALRVASVEGEVFTAELVARVRATGEREMLECLSGELDRRHRLVRAQSIEHVDGQLLSRYRFRHILFQNYLYGSLDEVERVHLHGQVGTALEQLYGTREGAAATETIAAIGAIAPQLARHFEEAKNTEKAIHYLHQAGERAVSLSAYQEVRAHLTRELALLLTLPDSPERAEHELDLQLSLGWAWMASESAAIEALEAYTRAIELCRQTGKTSELPRAVGMLQTCHYVAGDCLRALELAEEALHLGQQAEDPMLVAAGHWRLGFTWFTLAEHTAARAHLKQISAYYQPEHHHAFVSLCGSDPGPSALAYDACSLWCLGYPEQALQRSQEALALARELNHSPSLAEIHHFGGCLLSSMRHDAQSLKESADELMQWADDKGMRGWVAAGILYQGEALVRLGQVQAGTARMREGMAGFRARGAGIHLSGTRCCIAEAQALQGHSEDGLATLDEALTLAKRTGERLWQAELYRVRGELLLAQSAAASTAADRQAESCFQQAIEVARRQQARSWELRATTSLARLWWKQGRVDEARQVLAEIYRWFSEGFDSADLVEARTLLEELS